MKKLIISGSSELYERALYWRGYFEGRGYEVIDYPTAMTDDPNVGEVTPTPGFNIGRILSPNDDSYNDYLTKIYQRYWRHLDQADVFFLMNEDRDGIEGRIGYNPFAELTHTIIGNLNRGKKTEIYILKMPAKSERCYHHIKFWLDQGYLQVYRRPTGKKAAIPVSASSSDNPTDTESDNAALIEAFATAEVTGVSAPVASVSEPSAPALPEPVPVKRGFFGLGGSHNIDILTCNKKCLRHLTPEQREYLQILSPEFPAWLLRYIAAPEFQRLANVSMVSVDHAPLYNLSGSNPVFAHSIGVALILWRFTHDKKTTLAGLFHDIASPSFKHVIDYLHNDSETQESIEAKTGQIIRESRVITRQLKKDGILASEIEDYKLYPLADNDIPGLAADRLEYTFSNGYFLFGTWTLDDIKRLYADITILENEHGFDEFGFRTPALAAEFTTKNLKLAAEYHSEKSRATLQFISDIIKSMINAGYLGEADLFTMSEREIIDWILSCGDRTISEAFRSFQRATEVWSASTAKKNCYSTSVRSKVRYIDPLIATTKAQADETDETDDVDDKTEVSSETLENSETSAIRVSALDEDVATAISDYLDEKQPKYVGFDFEFIPYSE